MSDMLERLLLYVSHLNLESRFLRCITYIYVFILFCCEVLWIVELCALCKNVWLVLFMCSTVLARSTIVQLYTEYFRSTTVIYICFYICGFVHFFGTSVHLYSICTIVQLYNVPYTVGLATLTLCLLKDSTPIPGTGVL